MLRDRILLIEREIEKQTAICGEMYLDIVLRRIGDRNMEDTVSEYEAKLYNLTLLKTELGIVTQMITDGNL